MQPVYSIFCILAPKLWDYSRKRLHCGLAIQFRVKYTAASSRLSVSLLTWGHFFKPGVNSSLAIRALVHFLEPLETVTLLVNTPLFFLKQLPSLSVFHNNVNPLCACTCIFVCMYLCMRQSCVSASHSPGDFGSEVQGSDSNELVATRDSFQCFFI